MWFIGLVIGGLIGGALGSLVRWDEAWMLLAAVGAVAGVLYKEKRGQAAAPALERRLAALEQDVREMKQRGFAAPAAVETPAPVEVAPAPAPAPVPAPAPEPEPVRAAAPPSLADRLVPPPGTKPAAPPQPAPRAAREPSRLYQIVFGGNILAKIGVVLLLIGVGSGLKLAIDFGMFPPAVRLLLATVAGIAMIGFGYSRMRLAKHRMFGLALQGGGFGVLYLVTYFAFARYGYIGPAAAFALFAGLGLACLIAAWRFEGEPLAILGLSGAFIAPLLASTGGGSHVILFSYYAVLDALIVGANVVRAWRVLALVAFGFTAFTGTMWAGARFTPSAFAETESFLALFVAIFSLGPLLRVHLKQATVLHWADVVLLFATPLFAAAAQTWLVRRMGHGDAMLAWSAVGAGIYYSVLAALLFARRAPEALRIAHSAIAIGFYTLAIPLAFGVTVTSAFWAIEGVALVWFGLTQRRGLAYAAGLLLQVAAGLYFLRDWEGARAMPVLNAFYVGCIVFVACGAWTAWLTKRAAAEDWLGKENATVFPCLAGAWALAWWLAANLPEISRFASREHETALYVAVFIVTAWALVAIGKALPSTIARYAGTAFAALALVGGLDELGRRTVHPMHDSMALALPAAFLTAYAILRGNERDRLHAALPALHLYVTLMLAVTLLREAFWVARELAPGVTLWPLLAWMLVPALLTFAIVLLDRSKTWPLVTQRVAYVSAVAPVLLAVAALAALYANVSHSGAAAGLRYLPVASFFDMAQLAVLFALYAWLRSAQPPLTADAGLVVRGVAAVLAFIWLSAVVMRVAHHWGDVPFTMPALLKSGLAQSMLSVVWTATALTLMIGATRQVARTRWFVGFALLGVVGAKFVLVDVINKGTVTWTLSLIGVGLLILAASYFSPAPPRARSAAPSV